MNVDSIFLKLNVTWSFHNSKLRSLLFKTNLGLENSARTYYHKILLSYTLVNFSQCSYYGLQNFLQKSSVAARKKKCENYKHERREFAIFVFVLEPNFRAMLKLGGHNYLPWFLEIVLDKDEWRRSQSHFNLLKAKNVFGGILK